VVRAELDFVTWPGHARTIESAECPQSMIMGPFERSRVEFNEFGSRRWPNQTVSAFCKWSALLVYYFGDAPVKKVRNLFPPV
jgi:hypothetical protein